MTLRRAQRVLVVAFAISLLLHLIFALLAQPFRSRQDNQAEVVSIAHRPMLMTRLQTPAPPPKVTPAPHPPQAVRPSKRRPQAAFAVPGSGGSGKTTAAPLPTPTPQATTPSAVACEKGDIVAAVTENPPQPDIPSDVRASGTSGVTAVQVRLDERGSVTAATLAQSSGNASLDLVAVTMARDARYSPALHACKPIASAYTYRVRFFAW